MIRDFDMIKQVYAGMSAKQEAARKLFDRPLTLSEKILVSHIAQELNEVAPYMVGEFEKDGTDYLNVDNSSMTYMLINAVKEQQEIIEKQQADYNELKAENTKMKDEIEKIKMMLK